MEQQESQLNRKKNVKRFASVFFIVMLLLTFFSNTILNYSLPEVSTAAVTSGTVYNKVRGQGTIETNADEEIQVSGERIVKEVLVEVGDSVKEGDVLFSFEEGENKELEEAEELLEELELSYAKSLLTLAPNYAQENIDIKAVKEELQELLDSRKSVKNGETKQKQAKKNADTCKKKMEAQQKVVDELQKKIDEYGEVGSYDTAKETLTQYERELETLKTELGYLKDDLEKLKNGETLENEPDATVTGKEREIEVKELEVENKQSDVDSAKKIVDGLKSTWESIDGLKDKLSTETEKLETLKAQYEEYSENVTAQSGNKTYEELEKEIKIKRNELEKMILALSEQQQQDALTKQGENLELDNAKKKIDRQKKVVEDLKKSSDLKQLKAKSDGILTEIACKVGDTVTKEEPLAKLQLSESGYKVVIPITKAQSKLIKKGDEATVESYYEEEVTATVKSVKPSAEDPNQKMEAVFDVKGNVNPGENISLAAGEKSNVYDTLVPNNAVHEDVGGKFVLVVNVKRTPLGNRYTISKVGVTVEASDESNSAITGNVSENDNVVTNSSKPLEDRMQVRIVE